MQRPGDRAEAGRQLALHSEGGVDGCPAETRNKAWAPGPEARQTRAPSHSCRPLLFWSITYFQFSFLLLLFQDLPPAVCLPPPSTLVS